MHALALSAFAILLSLVPEVADGSCDAGRYYGMVRCTASGKDMNCKILPANSTLFCRLEPLPAACAPAMCSKIDPRPDNCMDETAVCSKGFYGVQKYEAYRAACYSDNGIAPYIPEGFECPPCPPGFYCHGGAILGAFYHSDGTVIMVPQTHQPPAQCPFQGMLQDASMQRYITPCAGAATGCDEAYYVRVECLDKYSNCPCKCPGVNTFPVPDPASAIGGRSCGCVAGTHWDRSVNPSPMTCIDCVHGEFCPGSSNATLMRFLCPKGWTTAEKKSTKLSDCSLCFTGNAAGCRAGFYCTLPTSLDDASSPCKPCPAGFTCAGQQAAPVPCQPGFFGVEGASKCIGCPAGKYSVRNASTACVDCVAGTYQPNGDENQPKTACNLCELGKSQALPSQATCNMCSQGKFQSLMGQTSCVSCPNGTVAIKGIELATSLQQACDTCQPGKFASLQSSKGDVNIYSCEDCGPGTYQPFPGQLYCMSCPYGIYSTGPRASTSSAYCTCDEYNTYSGSDGVCIPCATCGLGTYMINGQKCTAASPAGRCARCRSCESMQYVLPESLCSGLGTHPEQVCKDATTCNQHSRFLNPNYSGQGSVDTTVCIPNEQYRSVYAMACPLDHYFTINTENLVATVPSSHKILPNADGRAFAKLQPYAGVTIYRSISADQALSATQIDEEFPLMKYNVKSTGYRVIASMVWSLDGTTLYVLRMDAVIVRMQVFPEKYRNVDLLWSVPHASERPYSAATSQEKNSPSIPVCVAVPQRPYDQTFAIPTQVELICSFDQWLGPRYPAYLVRVYTRGMRAVDMQQHSSTYAASSLLYDVSMNVVYWTVWKTWEFPYSDAGNQKMIRRILLDDRYDVDSIEAPNVDAFAAPATFTGDAFPLGLSLDAASIEPESNILYAYLCTNGNEARMYKVELDEDRRRTGPFLPLDWGEVDPGMLLRSMQRFDSPLCRLPARFFFTMHGILFYQLPYNESALGAMNVYAAGSCERCPHGLISDGTGSSASSCRCPSGRFMNGSTGECQPTRDACGPDEYIVNDATPTSDKECARCSPCPGGMFRLLREDECDGRHRVDPVRDLGVNEQTCAPCSNCAYGKYIAPGACDGYGTMDTVDDARACISCRTCPDMHMRRSSSMCRGDTKYDTTECVACISKCPDGTYIREDVCDGIHFSLTNVVEGSGQCKACPQCNAGAIRVGTNCTGQGHGSIPDCLNCDNVCEAGQYVTKTCDFAEGNPLATCADCSAICPADTYWQRSCSGTVLGVQDIQCSPCETCPEGQYISRRCPGTNNFPTDTHQCSNCTASCSEGYYLAERCNGSTFMDVSRCLPCTQQCAAGQYIRAVCSNGVDNVNDCAACTPCSAGEYISSGACRDGTAKSPDERVCSKCSSCPIGKYVDPSTACGGGGTTDTQRCLKCSACQQGYFIKTQCSSAGTSPAPLQCSACRTCQEGFYRKGCAGNSTSDDVVCTLCPTCPRGYFIGSRCTGTEFSASRQACKKCDPCKLGEYYSSGCTGVQSTGEMTCAPCRKPLCPAGQYASEGCRGDELSFSDAPTRCSNCSRRCDAGHYMLAPCDGSTFEAGPANCTPCTCPGGLSINPFVKRCSGTYGLQDQACRSGWVGPDYYGGGAPAPPSTAKETVTTTPSGSVRPSTTAAVKPPPATTPPPAASSSFPVAAIGGIVGAVAVVGLSAAIFCVPHKAAGASAAAAAA